MNNAGSAQFFSGPPRPLETREGFGFDVFDSLDRWLGKVAHIWAKAGGDLYVVRGANKEYLIPAVAEIVDKVDLIQRKIVIDPPPGLLDL